MPAIRGGGLGDRGPGAKMGLRDKEELSEQSREFSGFREKVVTPFLGLDTKNYLK